MFWNNSKKLNNLEKRINEMYSQFYEVKIKFNKMHEEIYAIAKTLNNQSIHIQLIENEFLKIEKFIKQTIEETANV